jgi:hypothetical protein
MPRSRILAALLAFALSLQLMLAGDCVTCIGESQGEGRTDMARSGHAAHELGMTGPAGHESSSDEALPPAQHHSHEHDQSPASTPCELFASCTVSFVIAEPNEGLGQLGRPESPRLTDVPSLSSRTIAPELPPPRA